MDYDIGWCKPPVATRFKPGQSGNPKGRPKKRTRSLVEHVAALEAGMIPVSENGQSKLKRAYSLAIEQIVRKIARGDGDGLSELSAVLKRHKYEIPKPKTVVVGGMGLMPNEDGPFVDIRYENPIVSSNNDDSSVAVTISE